MKIALLGYGKMGRLIDAIAVSAGHVVLEASDSKTSLRPETLEHADVLIDFSSHEAVIPHLQQALKIKKPLVIGTTGWEIEKGRELVEKAGGSVIYSPNFSLGISLFLQLIEAAKNIFAPFAEYEAAGVECHHNEKKDAPSGTAIKIAETLEIKPFASVRCGAMPGTHTLFFDSSYDTITLTHAARSREGFAKGAIFAAKWIINRKGWYTLDDMFRSIYRSDNSL